MNERRTSQPPAELPIPPPLGAGYPLSFEIHYIITVPDGAPQEASALQGFAPSLCRHHGLVRAAALLPSTIFDLTQSGQQALMVRRMSGLNPVHWHPQTPRAVRSYRLPPMVPFNVIIVNPEDNSEEYMEWKHSCIVPPVLVANRGGDLAFRDLNAERLRQLFLARCDLIPNTVNTSAVAEAKSMLSSWVATPYRDIGYQVGGHNSVAPNVMALTSAWYHDLIYGPFKNINKGLQPYVAQIVRTTNSILNERRAVGDRDIYRLSPRTIDVNLFAPSIYPHILQMKMPDNLDFAERKRLQRVLQALQNQDGYSFQFKNPHQFMAVFGIDPQTVDTQKIKPDPHPLLQIRAQELSLATAVVGSLAVSEFSSVMRLPNSVNRSSGIVRNFAQQYRGDTLNARKRLLAFRQVQRRLAEAVPPEFVEIIRESETGLRVISDAHLEWLDIDGLPLAIRKNVCRIPTTPGNLFVGTLGPQQHVRLSPADLAHVLIVSALERTDPISKMFDMAFDEFGKFWKDKIKITNVDVSCELELIECLNSFEGNIVIFDGHGAHPEDGPAVLYLKETPVDVWTLRDKIVRMPPIIILSACDTHAADRNHATVASGFLALGARAVLASVFPLFAPAAAIFAARLIYRLADFLGPAIRLFGRALTWMEVVSGMVRMQLLTDFLRLLVREKRIDEQTYHRIHVMGNNAINGGAPDPFGVVISSLVDEGLDRETALRELEVATANSSAISYLHVGRPETILIDEIGRAAAQIASLADPL